MARISWPALTLFGAVPILECVMDILELIDRIRQNHAIEHATIAVLGRKHDQFGRLGGSAKQDGFFVYGPTTADRIEEAANEAVERLRAGESHLAISPFCGTNFLLGGMTTALLTGMILGTRNRVGRLPQAMGLSALALIGSFRAGGYRPTQVDDESRHRRAGDQERLTGERGVPPPAPCLHVAARRGGRPAPAERGRCV